MLFSYDAEDRVEEMIGKGREITRQAIEDYKPVAIFGGFSGGDDSIVATHFAVTEFGAAVAHCNTLTGVEANHKHVLRVVDKFGWHLIEKPAVATGPPKSTRKKVNGKRVEVPFDPSSLPTGKWQDGETAYEEFCFNFGMPGPGQHARQYQRLKERSFNAIRREAKQGCHKKEPRRQWELNNKFDWLVLGFTSEEVYRAERFRKKERSNLIAVLIEEGYTKRDCFLRVAEAGIRLPHVYALGYPNANCIGCVKASSPTYWNHVRKRHPDVFAERAEQSRRLGARLVRVNGTRMFLDELPEDAVGQSMQTMDFECGLFCEEVK